MKFQFLSLCKFKTMVPNALFLSDTTMDDSEWEQKRPVVFLGPVLLI